MLGEVGGKWLDRLHQHVAKDLRRKDGHRRKLLTSLVLLKVRFHVMFKSQRFNYPLLQMKQWSIPGRVNYHRHYLR